MQAETNDDERGDIEDGTVILSAMLYHPTKVSHIRSSSDLCEKNQSHS